jgi:cyclopropane fatty-acyl-phospholipid synthase-like methyltransferase
MPGLRSILSLPRAYGLFWHGIGGPKYIKVLLDEYVRPRAGHRVLDIGCGPGNTVPYFPDVEYTGVDMSAEYIEAARKQFPTATFVCQPLNQYTLRKREYFDVVLALGILHHLDDAEAHQLFEVSFTALKPDGRLVTFDGVFTEHQSWVARYLLNRDRGRFVRDRESYVRIASRVFANVRSTVRHDLLRVPYTHVIMTCTR